MSEVLSCENTAVKGWGLLEFTCSSSIEWLHVKYLLSIFTADCLHVGHPIQMKPYGSCTLLLHTVLWTRTQPRSVWNLWVAVWKIQKRTQYYSVGASFNYTCLSDMVYSDKYTLFTPNSSLFTQHCTFKIWKQLKPTIQRKLIMVRLRNSVIALNDLITMAI